jgi:hypothetical protein
MVEVPLFSLKRRSQTIHDSHAGQFQAGIPDSAACPESLAKHQLSKDFHVAAVESQSLYQTTPDRL